MTMLVEYIGRADTRSIRSSDFASVGLDHGTVTFSKANGYEIPLPDQVALYLIAQNEFRTSLSENFEEVLDRLFSERPADSGPLADLPTAAEVFPGFGYYADDEKAWYVATETTMERMFTQSDLKPSLPEATPAGNVTFATTVANAWARIPALTIDPFTYPGGIIKAYLSGSVLSGHLTGSMTVGVGIGYTKDAGATWHMVASDSRSETSGAIGGTPAISGARIPATTPSAPQALAKGNTVQVAAFAKSTTARPSLVFNRVVEQGIYPSLTLGY